MPDPVVNKDGQVRSIMIRSSHIWFVSVLFLLSGTICAQGGKGFLKEGDAFREQNELSKAVERYSLAIDVDPQYIKAYLARAEVFQQMGRPADGALDLHKAADLERGDADLAVRAAQAYLTVDSPLIAREFLDRALEVDRKHMEAVQTMVRVCLALNDVDAAAEAADKALGMKATTDTYYLHGLARMAVHDYATAETDFDKVISWNHLYEPAYVALSETQLKLYDRYSGLTMQMRALEKAIEKCGTALELNPRSTDALFTRSKAFALQKDYARAIDDISRCIALERTDKAVYHQRATYYHGFGQHQNAVNDLNKILLDDPNDVPELLLRAECKEANLDMNGALKDLDAAAKVMDTAGTWPAEQRTDIEARRTRIAAAIFEMERESDAPDITVIEPYRKGDLAQVSAALDYVKVSGHVRDKSLLKSITVNGLMADFTKDDKDPEFVISVPLSNDEKTITVQAVDVYDNLKTEDITVERSEGIAPSIVLTSPATSGDRTIMLEAGKNELFIEGAVTDASLIRLVAVNGVNASYAPDQLDPEFSIKVELDAKERFTVRAEDQYGNAAEANYTIVRKAAPVVIAKPPKPDPNTTARTGSTGVTWIIAIENTNYKDFPALQGTASDIAKMNKAFANYSSQKTITKKNLSKEQLERFFNIELRDLVRVNKVNTVLVWYSGHGRTLGGKAYWVPIDGKKDDIYSYFNYGSLKRLMQNYSETVTNTLVVSDAAGSDPSFYELTR